MTGPAAGAGAGESRGGGSAAGISTAPLVEKPAGSFVAARGRDGPDLDAGASEASPAGRSTGNATSGSWRKGDAGEAILGSGALRRLMSRPQRQVTTGFLQNDSFGGLRTFDARSFAAKGFALFNRFGGVVELQTIAIEFRKR